jgi:hypothetical protein
MYTAESMKSVLIHSEISQTYVDRLNFVSICEGFQINAQSKLNFP